MNKITDWIDKNIFGITLYLGVTALVFQIVYLSFRESSEIITNLSMVFNFNPVELSYLRSDIFSITISTGERSYIEFSYLNFIYFGLLILGALMYKYRKSKRILAFSLCIMLISVVIRIVLNVCWFFDVDAYGIEFKVWYALTWFVKPVVLFVICYLILKKLLENSGYRINEAEVILGHPKFKLLRPEWYLRLANVYVDAFITIFIFSVIVFQYYRGIGRFADEIFGYDYSGLVVFVVFSTVYYLFFEGIFKTTPGKILTNTRIVSFSGGSDGFGWIFLRTLSRRIPFNGLSFLGKIGWHDSISETTLAKLEKEEKTNLMIYRGVLIGILCIFLISIIIYYEKRW